jgi:pSer/pThr/pTyr-binding forkhead associated (FHA) protein
MPDAIVNLSPDLIELDPLVPPDPLGVLSEMSPDPSVAPEVEEAVLTPVPAPTSSATQLQQQSAKLLHLQTNVVIELPPGLPVVHLGKPNDRIPPDVDVSGFPDSEIVSRIHADIRIEGDSYFIEDVGSSNGTYINNAPLPLGNRHRLRAGDRVSLGKGDKVSFLFQLS